MTNIDDLKAKYSHVHDPSFPCSAHTLGDGLTLLMREWISGPIGMETFGPGMNTLDGLSLLAASEKKMEFVIFNQIRDARNDDHSWNEIAAAMGVSRQAVRKRFKEDFPGDQG